MLPSVAVGEIDRNNRRRLVLVSEPGKTRRNQLRFRDQNGRRGDLTAVCVDKQRLKSPIT